MNQNPLWTALQAGKPLVGFSNTLAAEGLVEAAGRGFDFIWIDAQHGHHTTATARQAVREAQHLGLSAAIRVPGHEYGLMGPFLDTGTQGVIVPMVETPAEADAIVRATRFPPRGSRSFGGRRVCDLYGYNYHQTHEPVVIAQIESATGFRNAEAIIGRDGIDLLLLGHVDLAIDLGLPRDQWSLESERLQGVLRELVRLAGARGKWVGCVAPTPAAVAVAVACGCRFISAGDETGYLRRGLAVWLDAARERRGEGKP